MITRSYSVHGLGHGPVEKMVEIGGESVPATVQGLAIELVPHPDPEDGPGVTLRFVPPKGEMDALIAEFAPGTIITATFAAQE